MPEQNELRDKFRQQVANFVSKKDWVNANSGAITSIATSNLHSAQFSLRKDNSKPLDQLKLIALDIWQSTYGEGLKPASSENGDLSLEEGVELYIRSVLGLRIGVDIDDPELLKYIDASGISQSIWAVDWINSACSVIKVGYKYAAAAMATTISKQVCEALEPPWQAFCIELPHQFIDCLDEVSNKRVWLDSILVRRSYARSRGMPAWTFIAISSSSTISLWKLNVTAAELAEEDSFISTLPGNMATEEDSRKLIMLGRLVLNVVLDMTNKSSYRQLSKAGKFDRPTRVGKVVEPPKTLFFEMRRPITIDLRAEIKEYLATGVGSSPKVRTLVMGHRKNQPCGPQGKDRKIIWVEPYWRGPDGAPIAIHAHKIKE